MSDFESFLDTTNWEQEKSPMGPVATFTHREKLLIFLITLRQGFTFSMLCLLCGLTRSTVTDMFVWVLEKLFNWSQKHVTFPTIHEMRQMRSIEFFEDYGNVYMLFVDGTVLPILRPSNDEMNRNCWNFKHKMVCKCFSILISETGRIVWVSETGPGKTTDREAWNESKVAVLLAKAYAKAKDRDRAGKMVPFTMAIGADKGYPGIRIPTGWELHLTKSVMRTTWAATNRSMEAGERRMVYIPKRSQVHMDVKLAKYRSKVEIVIGKLKENLLFDNRHFVTNQTELLDKVVAVAAAIHNWKLVLGI
jgi:hypothetical protein